MDRNTTTRRSARFPGRPLPTAVLALLSFVPVACGADPADPAPPSGSFERDAAAARPGRTARVTPENAAADAPDRVAPADLLDGTPFPALAAGPAPNAGTEPTVDRQREYDAPRPKSVLDLQRWRAVQVGPFTTDAGREGLATLVDLNPAVGAWLVLRVEWLGGGAPEVYHLENPFPGRQSVRLDPASPNALVLERDGERFPCDLWSTAPGGPLAEARAGGRAFAPLCGEWLYLRNPTHGRRTSKEWTADFLRDRVWGGERITTLVRDTLFAGRHRRKGRLSAGDASADAPAAGAPAPPALHAEALERLIEPDGLGLSVERESGGRLVAGRWYPVRGVAGVFVSAMRADLVAREIVERQRASVSPLEAREEAALVYVVAFDLGLFDLGFALGTEHPRVGWSERALDGVRNDALPGPDGIGTVAPLVRTGMLSPAEAARVTATFTGGFKRSHGAFNASEFATRNAGTHYGFVEQGVVLSKLWPGLSTLAVYRDGRVFLGTWSVERDAGLAGLRYARQNGVPILERDPTTGQARPGGRLRQWGAGNWSGSVDKKLRTLRAGACLQQAERGTFLLYGLFTSATPSGMARVFEAYDCTDAMLLDMNALEHTYLAVYRVEGDRRVVERLIDEMQVLDKVANGQTVPRFVGFPDNRDFFFLLSRTAP